MRKFNPLVFLIFFLLGNVHPSFADNDTQYASKYIPASLLENADAVMRIDEIRFEIKDVGHGIEYHHKVISIINKKGDKFADFVEAYDNFSKIKFKEGCIYNANGKKVKNIWKADIRDYAAIDGYTLFSDNRIKEYSPDWGQYPYTIEYSWEIHYDGLLNYPYWSPLENESLAIESASLSVSMPSNFNLRCKEFNIHYEVSKDDELNHTLYMWKVESHPAIITELFSPEPYYFLPQVILAPESFEIEGFKGNMTSWLSFGHWIRDLNIQKNNKISIETQNTVKELVKDVSERKEKIRKIYEFMQSRTRYVGIQLGIGGWKPFPAGVVDRNSYGDCKALTNYMQALLATADILSYYSCINGGDGPELVFPDFPCNIFNHIILCVPNEKDTIWLECTSQTNPFGYTGESTDNRYALVIGAVGGTLVKTRHYTLTENYQQSKSVVTIDTVGNAMAEINTSYQGCKYDKRSEILSLKPEDQKKFIYERTDIQNFELLKYNYSQIKDVVPVLNENIELKIKGFATTGEKRTYFTPNLSHKWKIIPSTAKKRSTDILIRRPFIETDSIVYSIPQEMNIEYQPEDLTLTNKFGAYSISIKHQGNNIIYMRRMALNEGQYPCSDYQEFAGFLKQIARLDEEKIVLLKK